MQTTLIRTTSMTLLAICLLAACNKKEQPPVAPAPPAPQLTRIYRDTIKPLPYFPVFPGSWWVYDRKYGENRDTITKTASGYVLDSVDTDKERLVAWVPVLDHRIWGYRRNACFTANWYGDKSCFFPELSETWGDTWQVGYSSPVKLVIYDKVIAVDTSLTLSGHTYSPVIVVGTFAGSVTHSDYFYKRYYAKNIGLVLKIENTDTTRLLNYHISQ